jgi:hypothetical protein
VYTRKQPIEPSIQPAEQKPQVQQMSEAVVSPALAQELVSRGNVMPMTLLGQTPTT